MVSVPSTAVKRSCGSLFQWVGQVSRFYFNSLGFSCLQLKTHSILRLSQTPVPSF